jgi:hypothetical protein
MHFRDTGAVRDGMDGILTPPGDVEALAAALKRLFEDDNLRRQMGAAALKRARTYFSIERMVDDYEALYWDWPRNESYRLGRLPAPTSDPLQPA